MNAWTIMAIAAFLAAAPAEGQHAIGQLPSALVEVDAPHDQIIIELPPVDLPARRPGAE
jgi:hypothetical protein